MEHLLIQIQKSVFKYVQMVNFRIQRQDYVRVLAQITALYLYTKLSITKLVFQIVQRVYFSTL